MRIEGAEGKEASDIKGPRRDRRAVGLRRDETRVTE
jgi:hypothetical protein